MTLICWMPKASQLRLIAPRLCGSKTSSMTTVKPAWRAWATRLSLLMRSSVGMPSFEDAAHFEAEAG